ncbi:hypothetical protein D3C76_1828550 [compost metagenome]
MKEISTNELVEEEIIKIEQRNELISLINTLEPMYIFYKLLTKSLVVTIMVTRGVLNEN